MKKLSPQLDTTYRSFAMPPKIPYEATAKDKMCFKAVTFMKVFFLCINLSKNIVIIKYPIHLGLSTIFI